MAHRWTRSRLAVATRGELFNDLACNTCHRSDGSGRGPSLVNKFGAPQELANGTSVAVDEVYVRESILTPQVKLVAGYQPLMPTFQGLLSEENDGARRACSRSRPPPAG